MRVPGRWSAPGVRMRLGRRVRSLAGLLATAVAGCVSAWPGAPGPPPAAGADGTLLPDAPSAVALPDPERMPAAWPIDLETLPAVPVYRGLDVSTCLALARS